MRKILIIILLAVLAFCAWVFVAKCNLKASCTIGDAFFSTEPPAEQTADNSTTTPTPPEPAAPPAPPSPEPATTPETPPPAQPAEPVTPPAPTGPSTVSFAFEPPGALPPGTGNGLPSNTIYVPGMRYPIEQAPSFLNSQVYGHGGLNQPGGQCDAVNYSYPWRDNFCETRSRVTAMCPGGKGHQGQDIRAATCERAKHWAVAAEAGRITYVGEYSITLKGKSGIIYHYLHMQMDKLAVALDTEVTRGQHLGLVSNNFKNGTPTTTHLHFEIKAPVAVDGGTPEIRFVPPYATLVDSYQRLLQNTP